MAQFGGFYSSTTFGDLITTREAGICRFTGLITLHWGFMADGSGEYAVHIDNSIKCGPKPCNPTTMQGGSLWNAKVTQTKSGLTGDITLKKVQCCGDCKIGANDPWTFKKGKGAKLKKGKDSGPDFMRNLRNTLLRGTTPGVVDAQDLIVIRRQILTYAVGTMGMLSDSVMDCYVVNNSCQPER